jgi:hypothetical protein
VSTLSKFQAVSSPATEKCNMNDVTVYTHEKLEWLTEQKIRFLMNWIFVNGSSLPSYILMWFHS